MDRLRVLESTAQRYRLMAGTITDQDTARRLLDYADELSARARGGATAMARGVRDTGDGLG